MNSRLLFVIVRRGYERIIYNYNVALLKMHALSYFTNLFHAINSSNVEYLNTILI